MQVPGHMPKVPQPGSSSPISRRKLIQGACAFSAVSFVYGCGSSNSVPSSGSQLPVGNPQPAPSGVLTSATLDVMAASQGAIGPRFPGLSYTKSSLYTPIFRNTNADLIALFKLLGPGVLRLGGDSDTCVWAAAGAGQQTGLIAPSDVDFLAGFLQATGWQCIYGMNLAGAGPNPYTNGSFTAVTTPALAADEAAYVSSKLGSSLLGLELGNEPDNYGSSYYSGTTWNLSKFESIWNEFYTAIIAQTPAVPLTGPATAYSESTWTVPFAKWATASKLSLLTQHYYRGATGTALQLIAYPDTVLNGYLSTLNSGAQSVGIPYRISECNSYYSASEPQGITDSYASSLWVIDFLFACASGGSTGVNMHGGKDYAYYTPIADNNGTVDGVRPEYYGLLLFVLAGQGELYTTQLSAGSLNVSAYAVKTSSGLNLIVNNKDQSNNLNLSIGLPSAASTATLLEMTQLTAGASAPDLTGTDGVFIQGQNVNLDGSFAPNPAYTLTLNGLQLSCYVPALSAVLIQIV